MKLSLYLIPLSNQSVSDHRLLSVFCGFLANLQMALFRLAVQIPRPKNHCSTADVEKTCFSTGEPIYKITLTYNQRRCDMSGKSYDELKAEMAATEQQMAEAKKNEPADALKEVKRLCKEFGFTAGMLKGSLAKGRGEK